MDVEPTFNIFWAPGVNFKLYFIFFFFFFGGGGGGGGRGAKFLLAHRGISPDAPPHFAASHLSQYVA